MIKKIPICRVCGIIFKDWDELARHVDKLAKLKDGKHKRTLWVKSRIHKPAMDILLKLEPKDFYHAPLTEQQKQNKKDSKWIVSEEIKPAQTYCPKCKRTIIQQIEIEYLESSHAVRTQQGILEVLCDSCRTK